MKKERKEVLLNRFPTVPEHFKEAMVQQKSKRVTANFVIFLTLGEELFARCYHRYYNGKIVERQRYVFAKDGCCRYGSEDGNKWTIRTEFREPVFCSASYGYNFDNSYTVLNFNAVKQSCMRYSCIEMYSGSLPIEYLKFYTKHPNVEYIMKSGYGGVINETEVGYYWSVRKKLSAYQGINWKSNNLLKMLGLNREEFKTLKGQKGMYELYCTWREKCPKLKPEQLLAVAKAFGWSFVEPVALVKNTGIRLPRLAVYLDSNNIRLYDYRDYLEQCKELEYNLHDTAISMPRDFNAMHTRLSQIIKYKQSEEQRKLFTENYSARKCLEYSSGDYLIRQPESMDEIVAEGAALEHCVGGYAERHARGSLHIMFIRRADKPEEPYFTMELSTSGKIVQVRGLHNCAPPGDVSEFVEQYKRYIANVFKKARKTA